MLKFVLSTTEYMTQVILNVPDNKLAFVRALGEELNFVVVSEKRISSTLREKQKEWVAQLKISLDEIEQHAKGEKMLKTAQQLLEEL